jgi:hypothetical protein
MRSTGSPTSSARISSVSQYQSVAKIASMPVTTGPSNLAMKSFQRSPRLRFFGF